MSNTSKADVLKFFSKNNADLENIEFRPRASSLSMLNTRVPQQSETTSPPSIPIAIAQTMTPGRSNPNTTTEPFVGSFRSHRKSNERSSWTTHFSSLMENQNRRASNNSNSSTRSLFDDTAKFPATKLSSNMMAPDNEHFDVLLEEPEQTSSTAMSSAAGSPSDLMFGQLSPISSPRNS